MPWLIPNGRQHPAGTGSGRSGTGAGRDRAGDNAGFGPIPQVVTREQGISSASAGPRPPAVGVLVVPVAGGEAGDGLAGQLGVRAGPRPVWVATSILLAGRASCPSHTKSDRTFRTPHCGVSCRTPNTCSRPSYVRARFPMLRTASYGHKVSLHLPELGHNQIGVLDRGWRLACAMPAPSLSLFPTRCTG